MFEEKDDDKLEAEKYEKYKKHYIFEKIKWPIGMGIPVFIASILMLIFGWDNIVCKPLGLILLFTSIFGICAGLYNWWKEKK